LRETDATAERLSTEIFEFRRRMNSMSAEPEKLPFVTAKNRLGTPSRLSTTTNATPKKETLKKHQRKEPNMVEILEGYDNRLAAIMGFEGKLTKFEELITQIKADLYGSVECIAEKVGKSVDPPKRGAPRITSNIQLVPPPDLRPSYQDGRILHKRKTKSLFRTWTIGQRSPAGKRREMSELQPATFLRSRLTSRPEHLILTKGDLRHPLFLLLFPAGVEERQEMRRYQLKRVKASPTPTLSSRRERR